MTSVTGESSKSPAQGAFSIPDIDGMVEGLVMDHNLSLMALDSDQLPIAVALNGAFHREEIDMPRQEVRMTIEKT